MSSGIVGRFKVTARPTRGGYRGVAVLGNGIVSMKTPVFPSEEDAKTAMRAWLTKRGQKADRSIAMGTFKVTARETRGGWRAVVLAHNGAVAFKTMPVFRESQDAIDAGRAWLREHGAHADRKRGFPTPRRGTTTKRGRYIEADPIRGRAYYVVDIRVGKVVAGPFSPVGKADKHLAKHYSTKTHQVIDGRYLNPSAHGNRRIAYRERKDIPRKFFALPERAPGRGALPLADPRRPDRYDANHVRNAAARLNMMHNRGSVDAREYHRAARAIMRGAHATGVRLTTLKLVVTRVAPITHEMRVTRMAAYSRRSH